MLLHYGRDTVHAPWAARARRVLPGTDLSALAAVKRVKRACPDFLSPPPDASAATFGEELERLRATSPEVVFEEVEALVRVEKESFDLGGVETLLSGLGPGAHYRDGTIELEKPYERVVEPAGRGITLVPCVFVWPRVEVLIQPGYQPTLAYGPRGVANLWASSSPPNGTALEAALGDSRASVLKSLLPVPITTTELARRLNLAPAAVSAHLSSRKVYYRLSCAGESLLGIFDETG